MRLICDERDRLWNEYGNALLAYSHSVRAAAGLPQSRTCWEAVSEAHEAVKTRRGTIRKHCLDHGCDPDWLREFGDK